MIKKILIGVDIGGTKCAVTVGMPDGDDIVISDDSGEIRLPREKVAKTKLAVIF